MREKWDNLFSKQAEGDSDGPLENTTTKNLLKVLNDTEPEATATLLNTAFDGDLWGPETHLLYVKTQKILGCISINKDPFLLGVSQEGDVELDGVMPSENQSIIDGVIETANPETTMVLEVKTGDASLDAEQLVRYANRLGIAKTGDELANSSQFDTISWYEIAGVFHDLCENKVDTYRDRSSYLYREFVDHLLKDHLESTLSYHGGDYPKMLSIYRQQKSSTNWERGAIMFDLRWKGNSAAGAFSSGVFDELLGGVPENRREGLSDQLNKPIEVFEGIPESIRKNTFGRKEVNPSILYEWAREQYQELNQDEGNHNLSSCAPLTDGRTYRFHFKRKEGNLGLRLVRYTGTDYNPATYPNLVQSEFESIFGAFPKEVREEAFCGEPNTASLWQAYLEGKIGPAAEHEGIDPLKK